MLHCVEPSLGPRRVSSKIRASVAALRRRCWFPREREARPTKRSCAKRCFQMLMYRSVQLSRRPISLSECPPANSRINLARFTDSAANERLRARRFNSLRSGGANLSRFPFIHISDHKLLYESRTYCTRTQIADANYHLFRSDVYRCLSRTLPQLPSCCKSTASLYKYRICSDPHFLTCLFSDYWLCNRRK